jgi:molecular chaperone DnaK (HSP70)
MAAVPANATSRQRWVTMEALSRAGFRVLGLIGEPSAAAIEFAHRHLGAENKRSPKRYVVVYDLGGGTFDTSALSLAGRRFDLLATEGIARLGGDDFDAAILELALERAGIDPSSLDPIVRASLLDSARAAKESMSAKSRNVLVDLAAVLPGEEPIVLDAASVASRCQPMIDETIDLLDQLFDRLPAHGIDPTNARELGAVYVVGGGAAFTGVLKALRARHGRKIQLAPSPHAATAIGLAIAADPDSPIFVREAVTRHFGVWREAEGGREKIFDRIFAKDTMPGSDDAIVVRRAYRPAHTVGHLRFLECSALDPSGGPAGELTPWKEVFFPYEPELTAQPDLPQVVDRAPVPLRHEIVETYTYAPNGAISVDIRNVTCGYARSYDLGRIA